MSIFRTRGRTRREAAQWVARLGGGAGERDHEAFRAWYDADSRNAEAYDRMAAIWSASGRLSAKPAAPAGRGMTGKGVWAVALAACLLGAVALAFALRGAVPGAAEPAVSYATGRSAPEEHVLPDGSRVLLDAQSRVELAFSAAERRIRLMSGRARFTVAHEARPFIVQAGADEIVATGTVFDVSLLESSVSVALLEGTVEVRHGHGQTARSTTRLTSGNRLVISNQTAPYSTRVASRDTAWANRMLEFDEVTLAEAIAMANRYSRTQIRIADEAAGALRVTGAYQAGDAPGLARGLAAAFGLRVSTDPDGTLSLSLRAAPAQRPHR